MKKQTKTKAQGSDRMRPEYDFSRGLCGKHAARYGSGSNVVVLAPDVARHFPTSDDVNQTLRAVAKLIGRKRNRTRAETAYPIDRFPETYGFPATTNRSGSSIAFLMPMRGVAMIFSG